jgi:two-component system LytT family response regulator
MLSEDTLTAVILEDEVNSREVLQTLLAKYCPQVLLRGHAASVTDAVDLITREKPDLVFMDVRLVGGEAFAVLERVKGVPFNVVFVTAYKDYAVQAIQSAGDRLINYLLKPIREDELKSSVNKAFHRKSEKNAFDFYAFRRLFQETLAEQRIPNIPVGLYTKEKDTEFVPSSNIVYCEADGNKTIFYFANGFSQVSHKAIGHYEVALASHDFFRVSNNVIINLHFIKIYRSADSYLLLRNGSVIEVSRRKRAGFEEKLKTSAIMP